jgi:hypothetical protein
MDRALDEAQLPKESEEVLRGFFHHMATFLMNAPTAGSIPIVGPR